MSRDTIPCMMSVLVVVGIGYACAAGWYFYKHCWNVPAVEMSSQCVLLIYTAK